MPSNDLIENIARAMQRKWTPHIEWDCLHGQIKQDYLAIAKVASATILAALQEPSDEMLRAFVDGANQYDSWREGYRDMLAASPLGEQSE